MKIALLMLLLVATASPVLARPTGANRAEPSTITCETVRAYVSQVGLATASALPAIRALNEALHPIPRSSQESALRESHEAGRFHTTRVISRHDVILEPCLLCPRKRTLLGVIGMSALCRWC
jgi:hypothetical protein